MDSLQEKRAFYKRTRKGKVIRLVRESYHRSDIGCGYICGKQISESALQNAVDGAPHKFLLFIDTNIALHQIDILEYKCPATSLIVILQTVLQELQHLNLSVYRRLLALMKDESRSFIFFPNEISSDTHHPRETDETPNNHNDRLIRLCAAHFQTQLTSGRVLLLTNDRDNAVKAKEAGLHAMTMRSYVEQYLQQYPELLDLVAVDESYMKEHSAEHKNALFPTYISPEALHHGVKTSKYFKGTLRSRGSNWNDGYVVVHNKSDNNVERMAFTIQGSVDINRALDGDVVAIEEVSSPTSITSPTTSTDSSVAAIPEETAPISNDQLENLAPATRYARVVGIIRRNWRHYAGSININQVHDLTDDGTMVLFQPVDPKIPPIYITTRRLEDITDKRILVAIDTWPVTSQYPCGHYVRILGDDGDKQVLLHEFGVSHEAFSTDVMACLPPATWKIDDEIIAARTDLRHIAVTSIDPPGCKDIDDALHCRVLPNGNYEVGVHIADVSYFVHPDTPIDKEAAHRSTSTYLVERRLDMLPGLLTTELCSLRCDEDHLVFSVIWEMDDEANIIDVQCFKAVIRSVASFTYDQAQTILDDKCSYDVYKNYSKELAKSEDTYNQVVTSVKLLNKLAKKLRERRLAQGALMLASPEVRFTFDDNNNNPTDVTSYVLKESNKLVEEWMLIANITVSKKILRHFPTLGVLRRHAPPSKEQFAPLVSAARAVGIDIDISTSKTLADSLDRAVLPNDEYFNKLIRILSTRCMMPAQYFCSGELPVDQWHHYGLAAPVYTHFTSPIRRYADLVVHRLLAAALGIISLPVGYADRSKQQDLCNHMNRRHRAAQHVQRANKPTVETAYVLAVQADKLTVLIPRFGIEGSIDYEQIFRMVAPEAKAESLENRVYFNAEQHTVVLEHPDSGKAFLQLNVFQKVDVHIRVEDANTSNRKLVVNLVLEEEVPVNNSTTKTTTNKKKRASVDGSSDGKPVAKKSKVKAGMK